jgi:hypothetical protein
MSFHGKKFRGSRLWLPLRVLYAPTATPNRLIVVVAVQLAVVAVEVVVPRVVGIPLRSAPVVAPVAEVVEVAIGVAVAA